MTWKRKRALAPDVVRAMLPPDREVVWAVVGEYHPKDMATEVQTVLGIPEGIYDVLFTDCEAPYKEEKLD